MPPAEVEEVRLALLAYAETSGQTMGQIAERCELPPSSVYDFVGYRTHSIKVIKAVTENLPLDLALDLGIRRLTP